MDSVIQTPEATRSTFLPIASTPLTKDYLEGLLASLNAGDNLANLQATHLWSSILNCIEKFPTSSSRFHVRTYKQVFTGRDCVMGLFTFLQAKCDVYPTLKQPDRAQVLSLCQQLLDLGHLQSAAKSSKSIFQPDMHPYRFSRTPNTFLNSPIISECSTEVSNHSSKKRTHRYHPYLKLAKNGVKKIVGNSRDKKLVPEEEHEWVDTVMSRILTHVDMPYLDKIMGSKELTDDVIKQNLTCITGDEDGYIPQWVIQIFDWLAAYKKGDKLSDFNSEHLKIPSSEEGFPSNLLTRLSRHFDTSMGPLIHHSLFELFETIAVLFTGETVSKKATLCIQLFLLLVAPHKRLNMRFLFTNLARISANDNFMCADSEERLIQFLKAFIPCIVRSKEKITRTQPELYTDIIPVLCYMARNADIAFDVPADIKAIYLEENRDFSFQDFLSDKLYSSSPLSKCIRISTEPTDTREELKKLLDNIVKDVSLTKEKKEDLLHQFSVVYPEIYSQNLSPIAFE